MIRATTRMHRSLIVRTTLLHARETRAVVTGAAPLELELVASRSSAIQ
jgi:hypothetical protein